MDSPLRAAVIAVCCYSASQPIPLFAVRRCRVLLLLCCTSLFFSMCCRRSPRMLLPQIFLSLRLRRRRRRRMPLPKYFCHIVCCSCAAVQVFRTPRVLLLLNLFSSSSNNSDDFLVFF